MFALATVMLTGIFAGGFLKFYFSIKGFASTLIGKAVPIELADELQGKMKDSWKKSLLSKLLILSKAKLASRVVTLATLPEQVAFLAVRIGVTFSVIAVVTLANYCSWYFAKTPLEQSIPLTFCGMLCGWFCVLLTVDKLLSSVTEQISALSQKAVKKGAEKLGLSDSNAAA